MASLLDLVLQRQNPVAAGLLASARAPDPSPPASAGAAPAPQGGGGNFLSRLVAGGDDPNLSPEQNRDILRQSLITAGLATAAQDNQKSGIDALASGLLVGRKTAFEARNRAMEAQEAADAAERRRQIGESISRPEGVSAEDIDRAVALALSQGDDEAVDRLIDLKGTLPGPVKPAEAKSVQLADGTLAVFDPNERMFFAPDGEPLMELPETVANDKDKLQYVTGVGPDGAPVAGVINLDRNTFTRVDGIVDPSDLKGTSMSPETIATAERATKARNNFGVIQRYLEGRMEGGSQNPLKGIRFERLRFEQTGVMVPVAQRQRLDTETQQFLQAQEAFMLELANQLAGVRGVSQENARGAIFRTFGFEEGDSPENIQNTLRELEIGVRSLEMQAGGALSLFEDFRIDEEDEDEDEDSDSAIARVGRNR